MFLLFLLTSSMRHPNHHSHLVMGTGTWVWVPYSRWDRYLGMTAAMTQVPVPTAICILSNYVK